ncbi:TIGR01244 family sulfur transferase [Palleronia caenipelagi]|uniref:TIGR01244 family phosphatase n=1 Tax=Palleronia caenipelagi TaxID=2489174 RepID=A0A547PLY8_9RHOB|nr:TIGR01244 family sulfur transferase [Palleronia caenipelagi]TRD15168.1 TIGR01244 family phosphatase [Palleronia caenipelagi]
MDIRRLSDGLSVAGQITTANIPAIREAGFRAVICNRPDGEEPGQPTFAEIEVVAKAAGLAARYIPVVSGAAMDGAVMTFNEAMREVPGPVLAYCRSGARSAALWSATGA